MYRTALVTNIPTPYTTPIYQGLAEQPGIALRVYFSARSRKNRLWTTSLDGKFDYTFLPSLAISRQGKDLFSYEVSPSIVTELKKGHYDVVIAGGYATFACQAAFLVSMIKGIPFVLRSGSTVYEAGPTRLLGMPLSRTVVKHSNAFLAYGTRAKEYLVKQGADPRKVFIAPNTGGVDYFLRHSTEVQAQGNAKPGRKDLPTGPFVLFVGQLIERKGVRCLLEAYRKLQQEMRGVGLVLAGDGPMKAELRDLCQRHRLDRVVFTGFLSREELLLYYCAASLFVLPSVSDPFSVALTEAMACGLPVIHTREGGATPDLVKEGINGYAVPAGDADSLCRAMATVLEEPNNARRMGERSRQIIQNGFTVEHSVRGFVEAIEYASHMRN